MTATAVLVVLIPAATVWAAHSVLAADPAVAQPAVSSQGHVANSTAATVAGISIPFLVAGAMLRLGYRQGKALYQSWHGRKTAAQASEVAAS
jgi:hypothetical protein